MLRASGSASTQSAGLSELLRDAANGWISALHTRRPCAGPGGYCTCDQAYPKRDITVVVLFAAGPLPPKIDN